MKSKRGKWETDTTPPLATAPFTLFLLCVFQITLSTSGVLATRGSMSFNFFPEQLLFFTILRLHKQWRFVAIFL